MADPISTITEVERTLDSEKLNCQWDSASFQPSPYVYISKQGVALVWRLLTRAKEEVLMVKTYEVEHAKAQRELKSCVEEMNHISDDNDALRREMQGMVREVQVKSAWSDKLTETLRELRGVFGKTVTHAELQAILARVDEVLGPGVE